MLIGYHRVFSLCYSNAKLASRRLFLYTVHRAIYDIRQEEYEMNEITGMADAVSFFRRRPIGWLLSGIFGKGCSGSCNMR